jgi:signal transduction histidine kinase
VEIVTQIPADLSPVFVDPRQIEQVLGNLVTNAYQAMPEGGRLTIETSEVSGKPPRSGWVSISITDTGCGIPEENMEKLFEPLFTTKSKGVGLGLATASSLVEANGGIIEVESEIGKGSTFTVRLPTCEERS